MVITYTSKDPKDVAKVLEDKYKVPIHVYKCTGEDSAQVDDMVEGVAKQVGEVDYVIANAGENELLLPFHGPAMVLEVYDSSLYRPQESACGETP